MANKGTTAGKFTADKKNYTIEQQITTPVDYIAVAGSSEESWDIKPAGFRLRESNGNRYRFINQAIRALYTFPKPKYDETKFPKVQRILVVFQFKYTSNDILKINEYAQNADARVIYVRSTDEFIKFLNKRKEKERVIKRMEIYSHGIIGNISFHYSNDLIEHAREMSGLFNRSSVDKLNKEVFSKQSQVISYACRTGISVDKNSFGENENAGQKDSLAQYIADKLEITVRAFEMRSDYANTYGTDKEIRESENYKGPDPILRERHTSIIQREENDNKDKGGPIMPKGAWHPPISGQTPKGLKNGLQTYTSQK